MKVFDLWYQDPAEESEPIYQWVQMVAVFLVLQKYVSLETVAVASEGPNSQEHVIAAAQLAALFFSAQGLECIQGAV